MSGLPPAHVSSPTKLSAVTKGAQQINKETQAVPDVEHAATIAAVTPAPAAAPATVPAATPAVAPGLLGPPRKVLAVYPQTKEISPLGLRFEDNLEIGAMSPNAICGQPQLAVG